MSAAFGYASDGAEQVTVVTMRVEGQLFALPVEQVQDVLHEQKVTPVPLAPREIAGSLNLRGRIVTVMDVRRRLGLQCPPKEGKPGMLIVVEVRSELYGFMVDAVGDVMTIPRESIGQKPGNMDACWRGVCDGVFPLKAELLLLLSVKRLLGL